MTRPALSEAQLAAIEAGVAQRTERARRRGGAKQFSYLLQYWLLRAVAASFRLLGVNAASALGGWIGRTFLARRLDTEPIRRTIRTALPEASAVDVAAVMREQADNVVRVIGEFACVRAFAGRDNPRLVVRGIESVSAARAGGRGVLFVMGHFANWEIAAIPLRNMGLDGVFCVMPPTNPHVYRWIARLRMTVGLSEQADAGEGVYRAFRRNLRAGRAAILLADQRLHHGIRAPFFGIDTVTNALPARLARTLGVAVVPLAVRRVGRGPRFEVEFMPPLEFRSSGDADADERSFAAKINAFYEAEIVRAPGQWLWVDPRWDEL